MSADAPPTGQPAARPTLTALLAARARQASDGRLVTDVAVGTVLVVVVLVGKPSLWLAALPPAALAAFGAWGIADRALAERAARGAPRTGLAILRAAAALLGLAAALGFALGAMAVLLENWIS